MPPQYLAALLTYFKSVDSFELDVEYEDGHVSDEEVVEDDYAPMELPQMSPFISAVPTPIREAFALPTMSPFAIPQPTIVDENANVDVEEPHSVARQPTKKVVGRNAKKGTKTGKKKETEAEPKKGRRVKEPLADTTSQHQEPRETPARRALASASKMDTSGIMMNVADFDALLRAMDSDVSMRMSVYDANFGHGRKSSIAIADRCEEADLLAAIGLK